MPVARSVLVVGVGSDLRRDDAVGRVVADRIDELALDGVAVIVATQLVPEMVESLAGVDRVVFVDASVTAEDVAVTNVEPEVGPGRSHHATPAVLLGLAVQLGLPVPTAFLVEVPATDLSLGEGLSDRTATFVARAVDRVRKLVAAPTDGGR